MSKFIQLTKITLINQLKLNKIFKKKNALLTSLASVVILLVISFIFGYILSFYQLIAQAFVNTGQYEIILSLGLLISSAMLVMTSLTRANAFLFRSKDFDLLVSLPIPLKTIVLSKILSFVMVSYVLLFFTLIPSIAIYAFYTNPSVIFYLFAFITFLLFPLLIIAIFSFISYFFATLLSRFKYKNLIAVIAYFVLFIGAMVLSFVTTDQEVNQDIFMALDERLMYLYFPAYLAKEALIGSSIIFLLFVLISVVPFVIFVLITSKVYVKINTRLVQTAGLKNFDTKNLSTRQTGLLKNLVRNEFKRIFSTPMLVINALAGKIIAPIFLIMFYFGLSSETGQNMGDVFDGDVMNLIAIAIVIFSIGITSLSSSSISLEGKQLWILKSSPIKFRTITLSKIALDFIISCIISVITVLIMVVLYQTTMPYAFSVFVTLMLFTIHVSLLGYIINLLLPKFNWELPIKVVKQSASVMVHMIISIAVSIGMIVIGIQIVIKALDYSYKMETASYMALGFVFVISCVFILIEVMVLKKFGLKMFKKLKS